MNTSPSSKHRQVNRHDRRYERKSKGPAGSLGVDEADHKKNMLVISGVSTNLNPSDFYRLAPSCLSDWESSIRKGERSRVTTTVIITDFFGLSFQNIVEQRRDPKTLEPLGVYQVSFKNSASAKSYRADLERLLELSQHKLQSSTGLWQSTVRQRLLPSDGTDVSKDVERLTVASPAQTQISIHRVRTSSTNAWEEDLSSRIQPLGYGDKPSIVLITVYPGNIQASRLQHFIAQDGWQQDLAWQVSAPLDLDKQTPGKTGEAEDRSVKSTTAPSRFIVACETEWEARRFHRMWYGRIISRDKDEETAYRHRIQTSIFTW